MGIGSMLQGLQAGASLYIKAARFLTGFVFVLAVILLVDIQLFDQTLLINHSPWFPGREPLDLLQALSDGATTAE